MYILQKYIMYQYFIYRLMIYYNLNKLLSDIPKHVLSKNERIVTAASVLIEQDRLQIPMFGLQENSINHNQNIDPSEAINLLTNKPGWSAHTLPRVKLGGAKWLPGNLPPHLTTPPCLHSVVQQGEMTACLKCGGAQV